MDKNNSLVRKKDIMTLILVLIFFFEIIVTSELYMRTLTTLK